MTHFGVIPLVCRFSIWPGQGFYIELFYQYVHFPLSNNQKGNGCFPDVSSEKTNSLLCFYIILADVNTMSVNLFNLLNFMGKAKLAMASCPA